MVIGGQFKSQSHIFGNISQKYTISAQCFRIGLNHFHFFSGEKRLNRKVFSSNNKLKASVTLTLIRGWPSEIK